jgi:hypothetical protein
VDTLKDAVSSDEEAIEQHLQSVLEDEIDQYNAYKDQTLLDKAAKGKKKRQGKLLGKRGEDGDDDEQVGQVYTAQVMLEIVQEEFLFNCVLSEYRKCTTWA